jgi:hypothetical protein
LFVLFAPGDLFPQPNQMASNHRRRSTDSFWPKNGKEKAIWSPKIVYRRKPKIFLTISVFTWKFDTLFWFIPSNLVERKYQKFVVFFTHFEKKFLVDENFSNFKRANEWMEGRKWNVRCETMQTWNGDDPFLRLIFIWHWMNWLASSPMDWLLGKERKGEWWALRGNKKLLRNEMMMVNSIANNFLGITPILKIFGLFLSKKWGRVAKSEIMKENYSF